MKVVTATVQENGYNARVASKPQGMSRVSNNNGGNFQAGDYNNGENQIMVLKNIKRPRAKGLWSTIERWLALLK